MPGCEQFDNGRVHHSVPQLYLVIKFSVRYNKIYILKFVLLVNKKNLVFSRQKKLSNIKT